MRNFKWNGEPVKARYTQTETNFRFYKKVLGFLLCALNIQHLSCSAAKQQQQQ